MRINGLVESGLVKDELATSLKSAQKSKKNLDKAIKKAEVELAQLHRTANSLYFTIQNIERDRIRSLGEELSEQGWQKYYLQLENINGNCIDDDLNTTFYFHPTVDISKWSDLTFHYTDAGNYLLDFLGKNIVPHALTHKNCGDIRVFNEWLKTIPEDKYFF